MIDIQDNSIQSVDSTPDQSRNGLSPASLQHLDSVARTRPGPQTTQVVGRSCPGLDGHQSEGSRALRHFPV
jgi:hypothetical protein